MALGTQESPSTDQDALDRIVRALAGLRYGSVQIIVQDGKVVQIEKTEKLRLTA